MLDPMEYDFICSSADELTFPAAEELRLEIREKLGAPISIIFRDFAVAFPLTVQAMEANWPSPVAGFIDGGRRWVCHLACEKKDENLFFNLVYLNEPVSGPVYDVEHKMLPLNWRELYRLFNSFTISSDKIKPMGWINSPFDYSARLTLERYRVHIGAKKKQIRDFEELVGTKHLSCWLLTDGGDALFLDEERCDHKVYHVKGSEFSDCCILHDADFVLDSYLASYVSGCSPADFDFRAGSWTKVAS